MAQTRFVISKVVSGSWNSSKLDSPVANSSGDVSLSHFDPLARPGATLGRMRDQLEHSFRRQADISSANSAGHVMCYRHFSTFQYAPLASANSLVIMWRRVWEEGRAMERPTRAPAQNSRATK